MVFRVAIAGGARGIGRATAEACLRAGMSVAIGDVDGAVLVAVAAESGERSVGLPLDVRDAHGFETFLLEAEERVGPLDALVNNAGVAPIGLFIDEAPRDTQRMVDVNSGGVLTGTRLALRRFMAWLEQPDRVTRFVVPFLHERVGMTVQKPN